MKTFCADKSFRNLSWTYPNDSELNIPGVPQEVIDIASLRGVTDFKNFFNPNFKAYMPDPYTLKDMDAAVENIFEAISRKDKICIYGDYDVDGATSTSLVIRYLKNIQYPDNLIQFYIPDRLTEGYGPNKNAFKKLKSENVDTVIVIDSGTTAFDPLEYAFSDLNLNIVILDHHQAEEKHPCGVFVNPKRIDDTSELDYLCSAGLTFLFLVGLQRKMRTVEYYKSNNIKEPDLNKFLGIVALGTVADVVPLIGLNRVYVKKGLAMMGNNPGIQALTKYTEYKEKNYTSYSCGFIFGPCINAAGRIDDTQLGTRLLSSDNLEEVDEIAKYLVEINKERQDLQKRMIEEAFEQAQEQKDDDFIVVFNQSWHPGIVGLVASRIKDFFDRSAIVIGEDGKGSARAVDGFDVGSAIIEARNNGILKSGGGHAAAGGLSVEETNIVTLKDFMENKCKNFKRPPLKVDLVKECGELSPQIISSFKMLEPFGAGNPEPRIVVKGGILRKTRILKGKHLKGNIESESGHTQEFILFNVIDTPIGNTLLDAEDHYVDLYGKAKINEYAGKMTVQIIPEDVMVGVES
jgi:single-stranded-DNA-specific exonuclease